MAAPGFEDAVAFQSAMRHMRRGRETEYRAVRSHRMCYTGWEKMLSSAASIPAAFHSGCCAYRVCSAAPPDKDCYRKYDETRVFKPFHKYRNIHSVIPAFPGTQRVLRRFLGPKGPLLLLLLLLLLFFVLWVGSCRKGLQPYTATGTVLLLPPFQSFEQDSSCSRFNSSLRARAIS